MTKTTNLNYQLVITQQQLDESIKYFSNHNWIALDTEFLRTDTFYPQISLVQLSDGKATYIIDLLTNLDFKPLSKILANKKITKVLHSARQDLEAIYFSLNVMPFPIFDTQIAAMLLGYNEPPGLDKLTELFLNQKINKKWQFSNWLKRPLSKEMLIYAADDVIYLAAIYKILTSKLKSKNLLNYAIEESIDNLDVELFYPSPVDQLKKISNSFFNKQQLSIAIKLIRCREFIARRDNLPRARIISNDEIINHITLGKKINNEELASTFNEYAEADDDDQIKAIVSNHKHFSLNLKHASDYLQTIVGIISEKLKISPQLVGKKSDLNNLIKGNPSYYEKHWRYNLFGKYLIDAINGKVFLSLSNGKIDLHKKFPLWDKKINLN